MGEFPAKMVWSLVVLLPKDSGGVHGIGLVEVIWKIISSVINQRLLNSVTFHNSLHGCLPCRGTDTAIIEAKLVQQLVLRKQMPLYEIFIDLKKAFDMLDHDRALDILEGYGIGPRMLHLLRSYWTQQKVVAWQSGYYGKPFEVGCGVTQGDVISPTIFNIIVDAVLHHWYSVVSPDPTDTDALGTNILERLSLFFVDDGLIGSTDPQWLQDSFELLVDLFEWVGLRTNTNKTKAMICSPGFIQTHMSAYTYKHKLTGQGESYRVGPRR
jgi:hypothetical protein